MDPEKEALKKEERVKMDNAASGNLVTMSNICLLMEYPMDCGNKSGRKASQVNKGGRGHSCNREGGGRT